MTRLAKGDRPWAICRTTTWGKKTGASRNSRDQATNREEDSIHKAFGEKEAGKQVGGAVVEIRTGPSKCSPQGPADKSGRLNCIYSTGAITGKEFRDHRQ